MMSYQFKLEALRKYRRFEEETRQKELADEQRRLDMAMEQLENYLVLQKKTESDMQQFQTESATGPQLAVYARFLQKLSNDIEGQRVVVTDIGKDCDHARDALLEAMKKRKALDKLKEKGLKAYLAKLDKQEEKFINEMAISRFTLKQKQRT
jgi:flagellar FliJ protein